MQQLKCSWSLPLWSSSVGPSDRSCEERTLKKIPWLLFFHYWRCLIKIRLSICFRSKLSFLMHLVALTLKIKNQLLVCPIFLISDFFFFFLVFVVCFCPNALIFGIWLTLTIVLWGGGYSHMGTQMLCRFNWLAWDSWLLRGDQTETWLLIY